MTSNNEPMKYSSDELISQRVNHLLFLHRLTRRKAAEELGISHSAFNTKINGGSSWRADELVNLTDRFGVSFDYLVGRLPIEYVGDLSRGNYVHGEDPGEHTQESRDDSSDSHRR